MTQLTATANSKRTADRLIELAQECLFQRKEDADVYASNGGKFVPGLGPLMGYNFRADKVEEHREALTKLIGEIVRDEFISEEGEGQNWSALNQDRNGDLWGSPEHANALIAIGNALKLCAFTHDWVPEMMNHPIAQMLGLPLVRFSPKIRE